MLLILEGVSARPVTADCWVCQQIEVVRFRASVDADAKGASYRVEFLDHPRLRQVQGELRGEAGASRLEVETTTGETEIDRW